LGQSSEKIPENPTRRIGQTGFCGMAFTIQKRTAWAYFGRKKYPNQPINEKI
jgi:hypothetical protein